MYLLSPPHRLDNSFCWLMLHGLPGSGGYETTNHWFFMNFPLVLLPQLLLQPVWLSVMNLLQAMIENWELLYGLATLY